MSNSIHQQEAEQAIQVNEKSNNQLADEHELDIDDGDEDSRL